jgi:hypothetical protein
MRWPGPRRTRCVVWVVVCACVLCFFFFLLRRGRVSLSQPAPRSHLHLSRPNNKKMRHAATQATEYHLGQLKAKLAKLRTQLQEPSSKGGASGEVRFVCCLSFAHHTTSTPPSNHPPHTHPPPLLFTQNP